MYWVDKALQEIALKLFEAGQMRDDFDSGAERIEAKINYSNENENRIIPPFMKLSDVTTHTRKTKIDHKHKTHIKSNVLFAKLSDKIKINVILQNEWIFIARISTNMKIMVFILKFFCVRVIMGESLLHTNISGTKFFEFHLKVTYYFKTVTAEALEDFKGKFHKLKEFKHMQNIFHDHWNKQCKLSTFFTSST